MAGTARAREGGMLHIRGLRLAFGKEAIDGLGFGLRLWYDFFSDGAGREGVGSTGVFLVDSLTG